MLLLWLPEWHFLLCWRVVFRDQLLTVGLLWGYSRLAVGAERALVHTLASLVGVATGLVALAWFRVLIPHRTVCRLRRATCSLQPLHLWEATHSVYHLDLLL